MATLINLPEDVHALIANFLRNPDNVKNPFVKAPQIAEIQKIHRNLGTVPLWKNFKWKELIRILCDKKLYKTIAQYIYGTLSPRMIKKGWKVRINNFHSHQKICVKSVLMEGTSPENLGKIKQVEAIYCGVTLHDLIIGFHPLSSALDADNNNDMYEASQGTLQLEMRLNSTFKNHMVKKPSAMTLIPQDKRRKWLLECFEAHVVNKFNPKTGCFMKEFKKEMGLLPNYPLSQTELFKMFLRELGVCSRRYYCRDTRSYKSSEDIEDLCRQEINLVAKN